MKRIVRILLVEEQELIRKGVYASHHQDPELVVVGEATTLI